MKTSELTGVALDWAVAKCEGREDHMHFDEQGELYASDCEYFDYSTDWAQGGPIIERERLILLPPSPEMGTQTWKAGLDYDYDWQMIEERIGPTPLEAAMRCYVASKLGNEIEIPKELL